jgi:hypothetical protein
VKWDKEKGYQDRSNEFLKCHKGAVDEQASSPNVLLNIA